MVEVTQADRDAAAAYYYSAGGSPNISRDIRERGRELGFRPCGDCFDGFCTMNCSSAPIIMKVLP